jgi:hypothetical protein
MYRYISVMSGRRAKKTCMARQTHPRCKLLNLEDNAEVSWRSPTWNHFSPLKHQYAHYHGYWVYYSITKQSGWLICRGWIGCQCCLFVVVCLLCISTVTSSHSWLHSSVGALPSDLWLNVSARTASDVRFWAVWRGFSTCRFSFGKPPTWTSV